MDLHGHGTHLAGRIAAAGNIQFGVAGVTWSTKIMPLRAADAAGSFSASRLAPPSRVLLTIAPTSLMPVSAIPVVPVVTIRQRISAIEAARTAGVLLLPPPVTAESITIRQRHHLILPVIISIILLRWPPPIKMIIWRHFAIMGNQSPCRRARRKYLQYKALPPNAFSTEF